MRAARSRCASLRLTSTWCTATARCAISKASRVGVFGGAFNPPHLGHLVCAGEALSQLELDRVLFVPTGEAPHKQIQPEPGREVRFELCRRATVATDQFAVSRIEIDRRGPSYTVDTLRALRAEDGTSELVFIMGGDQALTLDRWREPGQILALAGLAVAERDQARRADVAEKLKNLEAAAHISFFNMPLIDISSTMVRERVADGRPFRHLVPDGVADLITDSNLYRERAIA